MADEWREKLYCALKCQRCGADMEPSDKRILSVYDHEPICLKCKDEEEKREDYEKKAQHMIGQCLVDTELNYGDPGGYCYFHFYPFKC